MTFTILGGTGFIGRHLTAHLRAQGINVLLPPRDTVSLRGQKLGHVIYAIGLTGNFRRLPRETVDAHVSTLQRLMDGADFESWLYLSSTRIYGGLPPGTSGREDMPVPVTPSADTTYDLSKLLGESLCLANPSPRMRVARLSNVYGADQNPESFLGAVMGSLRATGKVTLQESPASAKDYISVAEASAYLQAIAQSGTQRTYNVASGENVTHAEVAQALQKAGYDVHFAENGPTRTFPPVDATRLHTEFAQPRRRLIDDLPDLIRPTDKETTG